MYDVDEPKVRVGYARDHARKCFKECAHLFPAGCPDSLEAAVKCILPGYKVILLDNLPNKISGIARKEEKLIGINSKHARVRQRFSLAHEIGHIKLNHPDIVFDPDGKHDKILESEANMFAGEFLVPLNTLKSVIKTCKDPTALATHFDVSKDVLFIRLKETSLINSLR